MTGIRTTEGWVPNEATERIFSRVVLEDFVDDIDWDAAVRRLGGAAIPDYVRSSIHGIPGGYGTPDAAATWDAVVKEIFIEYLGPETEQRARLCRAVTSRPVRILDVACGTGESTLAWRAHFPDAEVTAIDVSPFMLAVAERKLAHDLKATLHCLDAESLPFAGGSFDLVTASLLLHELPADVSPRVLAEMARVCKPGGEIAIMEPYDVRGRILHPIPFPEPYLKDFLSTDWDRAFTDAGFGDVRTDGYGEGWIRTATRIDSRG